MPSRMGVAIARFPRGHRAQQRVRTRFTIETVAPVPACHFADAAPVAGRH